MYNFPLDAILLCYGPLAAVIGGFIVFAWITDADAREPYLRRVDLRDEYEAPEVLPPVVTERTEARTPSGSKVIIDPTTDTVES